MSNPYQERSSSTVRIGDLHSRVRNLEAIVPAGADPSVCPDCVLDPFTVNPGDIFVPEDYRDCVDVAGTSIEFPPTCGGPSEVLLGIGTAGSCGNVLGLNLGLQVRISTALGFNIASLVSNVIVGTIASWTPGESPSTYDSGWLDVDPTTICGADCNEVIDISASFFPHSPFTCVGGGSFSARWVELNENDEYRGALDQLPQGDAFGDVIYFNATTHEFVTGPRSVPSRAMSTFMGG